ncbi:MAG: helix-hairpin-helix domain-containing protein, partial [Flavobacteriales bacterium]
ETVAKKLVRKFKNIESLQQASFEQLRDTDEVGEKIAASVQQWFASSTHQDIIRKLKAAGLQFEVTGEQHAQLSNILEGKTVVVSGVFQHFSRDGIKASVEQHGGKLSGSISKKTSMVIAGENMGPEKRKKAEDLQIPIISETEYLGMIEPQ